MLENDFSSWAFVHDREVDIWWLWLARTPSTPRAWLPGLVSAWDSENALKVFDKELFDEELFEKELFMNFETFGQSD